MAKTIFVQSFHCVFGGELDLRLLINKRRVDLGNESKQSHIQKRIDNDKKRELFTLVSIIFVAELKTVINGDASYSFELAIYIN